MTDTLDQRIPVVLGMPDQLRARDVLLAEGGHPQAAAGFTPASGRHAPGCSCCAPRTPAGLALAALLHERARGRAPFFERVVALVPTEAGRAELAHALSHDPVASACFRLSPAPDAARPDPPTPGNAA